MRIILNVDLKSRQEVDAFVQSQFGTDAGKNNMHVIELSQEKMTELGLSETATVFGVRIKKIEEEKKK